MFLLDAVLQTVVYLFGPMVAVIIWNIVEEAVFNRLYNAIIGYPCPGTDELLFWTYSLSYTE